MQNLGIRQLGALAIALLCPAIALSDSTALFSDDFSNITPRHIEISGPFKSLTKDRDEEPEEHAGTVLLRDSQQRFDITLQPRGKSRRMLKHCRFPPLWLKFDKDQIRDSAFAGHHKRKLVTHCRALDSRPDNAKVWIEMLAYRTLNLVTQDSYRVAPLMVTYVDSDNPEQSYTHGGFLIEHKKELAERLQLKLEKRQTVRRAQLDAEYTALVAVFNLLIGNPDFSVSRGPPGDSCCHNTVPFETDAGSIRSIPYDFDNTGLVKPRYAAAPPGIGISRVTQRVYRGYCRHNDGVVPAVERFVGVRAQIEEMLQTHPDINESERTRVFKFLTRFFDRFVSAEGQEKYMIKRCLA